MAKKDIKTITLPTKIEAAKNRIYKIDDIIKLSKIFFPQNAAKMKRASFVAIFIELRKAKEKKLRTLNRIPSKYEIPRSTFTRARSKMVHLGLIRKYGGYWIFSTGFASSMKKLADLLRVHQYAPEKDETEKEYIYVESAKNEDIFYRKIEDAVAEKLRLEQEERVAEEYKRWNEERNNKT